VYNQPLLDAFNVRPLFSEPMLLVGPIEAPGRKRSYHIRELADIPLILPGLPHSNRRLVEQAAIQHGIRLRVEIEVDSVALTKQLVKAGLGYSILTHVAIKDEVSRGEVVAYGIERPSIRSTVAITTLRESRPSRLVDAWSTMLQEKLQSLIASEGWKNDVIWA
jgi:LysR family nitrogen assimilation transcriptional regulator